MTTIRHAESEADLEAYVELWNTVTPDESSTVEQQRRRRQRDPRRLYLVAEHDGELVGCGYAGPSDTPGRGFLAPRVLPAARRQGIGSALLRELAAHLATLEFASMSSHLDGGDAGSLAFASSHGFEEVDRQIEQVKVVGSESVGVTPAGVVFTTLAERPELLRRSYDLAVEGYADMATYAPVTITLDQWLDGDGGDVPTGTFLALAGADVVGFTGLCAMPQGGFEDGLTVVRRDWRRRGLAEALKRAKLAWAAANGVSEIVTWTQRGNKGMRALNERLGYTYRGVSISVSAPLESSR